MNVYKKRRKTTKKLELIRFVTQTFKKSLLSFLILVFFLSACRCENENESQDLAGQWLNGEIENHETVEKEKTETADVKVKSVLHNGSKASTKKVLQGTWRGGPSRNGIFNVEPLKDLKGVKWTHTSNGKVSTEVIVIDNKVLFGTNKGRIYALSSDTGKVLWKKSVGSELAISIEAASGIVYLGTRNGDVYALSLVTGKKIWKQKPMNTVSMLLLDENLYVGGDSLACLNPNGGNDRWKHKPTIKKISRLAMGHDIIMYSDLKASYSVDTKSGNILWGDIREQKTPFTLCYTGKHFFLGSPPILYEPQKGTKKELKSIELKGRRWNYWDIGWQQVCTANIIYGSTSISTSSHSAEGSFGFGRVDLIKKRADWIREDLLNCSCASKAGDVIFTACSYHGRSVTALRKEDGKTLWNYKTPYGWVSCPWLENKQVFFATDRKVYALH